MKTLSIIVIWVEKEDIMKILTYCIKCKKERNVSEVYVELTNDSIYSTKCEKGHDVVCAVQTAEFVTLFEMGTLALNDGFTREAITSFSVAIERFHEFMLKVMLLEGGMKWGEIDDTWKNVAAQSERQLGAYLFIFASVFKKTPPIIPNSRIKFRNSVTHKGLIPTYKEAKDYERFAFDYIFHLLDELKSKCKMNNLFEVINRSQVLYNANPKFGEIQSFIAFSDIFNLFVVEGNNLTYESAIDRIIKDRSKYVKI